MNGSGNTIVHLAVDLRQSIVFNSTSVLEITDGRSIHNVSHNKPLDGFILWHKHGRRLTANTTDMSTSVLVASSISTFLGHFSCFCCESAYKKPRQTLNFKPRKNSLHLSYQPTTLGSIIESNTTEIQHKIIVISIHNAQENQHGDKEASTRSSRRFDGLPIQQTELRILLISRLDHSQRKRICYDSAVVWTPSLDPSKETPMSMRQEAENSATRFLVIPSIHTQINTLVPLIIKL